MIIDGKHFFGSINMCIRSCVMIFTQSTTILITRSIDYVRNGTKTKQIRLKTQNKNLRNKL